MKHTVYFWMHDSGGFSMDFETPQLAEAAVTEWNETWRKMMKSSFAFHFTTRE